ncbi:ACT domain-containing protein [Rhizobium sp. PAMB 3174]
MTLKELPGDYAVARLPRDSAIPTWADGEGFVSIGRTEDELSVVCLAARVPDDVRSEAGWTVYKFQGPFEFSETGIALSVIRPLSEEGVSIFLVSTFDTDYLLIRTADRGRAGALLASAGHVLS